MSMSRSETSTSNQTGFLLDGRWRIRPDINRIYDGEIEHQIPDKFMQVLMALVDREGVVSRQELFELVWPDTLVVDESLTRAISSLRKVLGDDPKNPRIIETIPKKGYRLVADVEPIPLETDQGPSGPSSPEGKRPSRLRFAALALLVAAAAAAGWWIANRDTRSPGPAVDRLQVTALPGIEEYPTLSPAGDRVAFIWDGDETEPDGVFVQVIGAGPPLRLTDIDGHYAHPAWTHDSRFIAFVRFTGPSPGIHMVPAAGGAEIELIAEEPGVRFNTPAFSPDGKWLIFARRQLEGGQWELQRKHLETGEVDMFAPSNQIEHGGYRPRFSPDGRHLAFFRLDQGGRELVIAALDGSEPIDLAIGTEPVVDFDWTPDGLGLAVSRRGAIVLLGGDGSTRTILSGSSPVGILSLARQRSLLAYSLGRQERNIWQWTPPTDLRAEEYERIIYTTAWDASPAISPDGRSMAFLSNRTGTTQLWTASRDGSDQHALTEIDGLLWWPVSWSPEGDRIAVSVEADGIPATRIIEVPGGRVVALPTPEGGENVSSWSRDGRSLYVVRATPGGEVIVRRSSEPEGESGGVTITDGNGFQAVESPDGSALFFSRDTRAREILRCELDGSDARVVFSLDAGEILTWKIAGSGLFVGYRRGVGHRSYTVVRHDLDTRKTTVLFTTPGRLGFDLDVDPLDDRRIIFGRTEAVDSDIFAIANY